MAAPHDELIRQGRHIQPHRGGLSRRGLVLWSVGIALAAGVLRLAGLGTEDYWLDELHSLADSAGRRAELEGIPAGTILRDPPRTTERHANSTVSACWRDMAADSHPPAYFLLLLGWRRVLGDSEVATRLLSVVFSVISIVCLMAVLSRAGKRGAAIWGGSCWR